MTEPAFAIQCPSCGYWPNRGLTVDAVITDGERFLAVKRGIEPCLGQWALVGGHVEWDETVENALAREIREECGLTVDSAQLLEVRSNPDRSEHQTITLGYLVFASGIPVAGDDAAVARWFTRETLPPLAFDHNAILEAGLQVLDATKAA